MGSTPSNPQNPYSPGNPNDPRQDPRNDPRWQREQRRSWEAAQRAQADAFRASTKAARRAQAAAYRAQAEANRQQWRMYRRINRRSSLIGPLLIISVGLVFLLIRTGRLDWVFFLSWYARWWPLLLIGIGVLRLGEWALDRARNAGNMAAARYTVGGGVGFAIFVLILAGLGLQAAHRNGYYGWNGSDYGWHGRAGEMGTFPFSNREDLQQFFGSKHEEDAPAVTHSILPNAVLAIENPRGEVTVAGTSDDGMLHLSVHKEIYTNSDDAATGRLQSLTPGFSGTDGNLILRVPTMDRATADLTLLVPAGVTIRVNANRGDVHVTNIKAPISVTSNNGDVEIAAITGDISAHVNHRGRSLTVRSVTGAVGVQGNGDEVNLSDITGAVTVGGDFFGGGHLQHISGPVQYNTERMHFSLARLDGEIDMDERDTFSASEVVGPFSVDTHSRNITLTRVAGDVRVTNNHGDVEVVSVPPNGSLTVDNHNGAITLSLPEKAKFTVNADTSDGDATTEFSGIEQNRGTIRGTVNGGGPVIRLTTSHGDIVLRKNTEPPLPPASPQTPRLTGFGSLPVPPSLPGSASVNIRKSAAEARAAARQAGNDARRAATEARQAAKETADAAAGRD